MKKAVRHLLCLALTALLLAALPLSARAAADGWTSERGKWRYYSGGSAWTGWLQQDEGWYYFDRSGNMVTGWVLDGNWYYLNPDGRMATGWVLDGNWYYFYDNGAKADGWIFDGSAWYLMGADGMVTGWYDSGFGVYYLDPARGGAMATGWVFDQGGWYYLDGSGLLQTGWAAVDGAWYYLDPDQGGLMRTGWLYDYAWYYLKPDGAMATGWMSPYYFDASGAMVTGWQQLDGALYRFDADGLLQTGWAYEDGFWYYLDPDRNGAAVTDAKVLDGKEYRFDGQGRCLNSEGMELPMSAFPYDEDATVNGFSLPGGSVSIDGVQYVSLREFCQGLGAELSLDERGFRFPWRGGTVSGSADSASLDRDGSLYTLDGQVIRVHEDLIVPVQSFCRTLQISAFHDEDWGGWYFTPAAGDWTLPEGYRVPVLMYHAVTDELWGNYPELMVSPSSMEKQLAYLAENGYQAIWFEDLEHIDQYDKPVILTFDDGYRDNYENLFPLLKQYNMKATIFVITGWVGANRFLTADMIREMSDSGLVSIQSHTRSHALMDTASYERQEAEMRDSKLDIVRMTGKEPLVICYPEGRSTETTQYLTAQYYRFGVKMGGARFVTGNDPTLVYRRYIQRETNLNGFANQIS